MKTQSNSMFRKMIYMLLCAMILTAICVSGQSIDTDAASTYLSNDKKYEYEIVSSKNKTVRLVGYKGSSKNLSIPTKITGKDKKKYTVVQIGMKAGACGFEKLTSVTIPATVTKICNDAFADCSKLTKLTFASGSKCTSIGDNAFLNAGLKEVTIPASVKSIGASAFGKINNNNYLKKVVIKASSMTSMGRGMIAAFCEKMYVSSRSVYKIAVDGCGGTVVYEGYLYEVISSKAKTARITSYCGEKTVLSLPDKLTGDDGVKYTVTEIDYSAFSYMNLTSVTIPASIKTIGGAAFEECTALTKVSFAGTSACESICSSSFAGTALTEITIPASVKSIDSSAFESCTKLSRLTFASGSKCTSIGIGAFYGNTALTSVTIPSSVTEIGSIHGDGCEWVGAFEGCTSLSSVTFANGSKCAVIGDATFRGTCITSIKIPSSVKSVGSYAIGFGPSGTPRSIEVDIASDSLVVSKQAIAGTAVYVNNISVYNAVTKNCGAANAIVRNYTIDFQDYDSSSKKWVSKKKTGNIAYTAKVKLSSYYNPTKRGYTLEWGTGTNTGKAYSTSKEYTKLTNKGAVTLYAWWTPKDYTIVYDGNGAAGGSLRSQIESYDGSVTLRTNGSDGFYMADGSQSRYYPQLAGWCLDKNGKGTIYTAGQAVKVSDLVTSDSQTQIKLYAIWKRDVSFSVYSGGKCKTYSVQTTSGSYTMPTYAGMVKSAVAAGAFKQTDTEKSYSLFTSTDTEYKTYGAGVTKKRSEIADFYSWSSEQADGSLPNAFLESDSQYTLTKAGTSVKLAYRNYYSPVYAYKDITISFDGGDADGTMASVTCSQGKITNSALTCKFTRGDQEFSGWGVEYKDTVIPLFTQKQIEDTQTEIYQKSECSTSILRLYLLADEDLEVTLVPIWTGTTTYTVQFKANGASGKMTTAEYEVDKDETLPACKLKKNGYTFQGWADYDADDDTIIYEDKAAINRTYKEGDIRLKAVWKANTYKVRYVANGGAGTMETETGETGTDYTVSMNAFERDGADFEGWCTSADGSGTTYAEGESLAYEAEEDGETLTLYAIWKMKDVKLAFKANGGSVAKSSKTVDYGKKAGTLPTPKRDGYTFDGWYTRKANGTKYTADTVIKSTGTVTLYAHWTAVTYKVSFDANGGDSPSFSSKTVKSGNSVGSLPTISRKKYEFLGWYTAAVGGNEVSATYQVKRAVTLYAHWKEKGRSVNVKISKIQNFSGSKGCEIQYSSSSGFTYAQTVTIENVTGTSASSRISGLKAGAKYYFRARAYKLVNGQKKYGSWSAVVSMTTSE